MRIENYEGKTFVAFMDISGFKKLMNDRNRALKAMDKLYQYGYDMIDQIDNTQVEGIFISDNAILFVRNSRDKLSCLKSLLSFIRDLNRKMLQHNFMLTTSIAFDDFEYENRRTLRGIEKHPVYGKAYLSAFLDNENGRPKIMPGQCRILKSKLLEEMFENLT